MDIGELLKDYIWVILALLFYLFAGRKKKGIAKGKEAEPVARTTSSEGTTARSGLQERLEQALREMQERAGQGSEMQPVKATAEPVQQRQAELSTPAISLAEAATVEPAPARNPFEFTSTVPLHQRKTALDVAMQSDSAMSMETAKPERFSGFKEGHGLRYHTHTEEMAKAVTAEFNEAHGLHYTDSLLASGRTGLTPIEEDVSSPLFRSEDDIRRAVITAEILGPPKALRRAEA